MPFASSIRLLNLKKAFTAKSALRICYANARGDDIRLYADTLRAEYLGTLPMLRQQKKNREKRSTTVYLIL